jgi:hypothetical protein
LLTDDSGLRRRHGLPDRAANEAIRYHPDCPFERERFPAMICLVRGIVTNEPQGVHRAALMPDGTAVKRNGKTFRLSLGPIGGGAIKLDPDEDVEQGLCIGEGVETCLSGRQIGLRPVWSAVNTGGVKNFPIVNEEARDHARSLKGTPEFEQSSNERKKVEMRFAHLQVHHGFERMRLRGLTGARDEFHLAAIVQNLKTLANHAWHPPPDKGAACAA